MTESTLLHELVTTSARRTPDALALSYGDQRWSYQQLTDQLRQFSNALAALGVQRGERIGVYLEKRTETVVASFGAAYFGCVMVPMNPLLKPEQVAFIARDCDVRVLVTSQDRMALLQPVLADCPALRHVLLVGPDPGAGSAHGAGPAVLSWHSALSAVDAAPQRVIDTDMVAILYTSGSTGKPKGVVLSHRNMVAGAKSVASYLDNRAGDVLLAALPLSFDAGFSQLTTAFHVGAQAVLLNYLMPRDVLKALARERVTGLTAVPPLYIQLTQLEWPAEIDSHLRYFANTGGRMPRETLNLLRQRVPSAKPFLMYGLTEAFRSTYLPPTEVDRRPDSIGQAIPNAEILVLRPDGSECAADEPGELVHRGPLVSLGYWNDAEKTAERFKLMPGREGGLQLPEYAVFSGDNVRRDGEGFLYFIGRRDEMMKTSGYRVSPTEVEEVLYASRLIGECAAFGVDHEVLGQAIQVIVTPAQGAEPVDIAALTAHCRQHMPAYMVPAGFDQAAGPLPRNPNGKIDRKLLSTQWLERRQAD